MSRTLEECHLLITRIEDMRRMDAARSCPDPKPIDALESDNAVYAKNLEPSSPAVALAHTADVCPTTAANRQDTTRGRDYRRSLLRSSSSEDAARRVSSALTRGGSCGPEIQADEDRLEILNAAAPLRRSVSWNNTIETVLSIPRRKEKRFSPSRLSSSVSSSVSRFVGAASAAAASSLSGALLAVDTVCDFLV